MLYAVEYSGPFGFLKPWTAVRDGRTNSQQFLTPSTVEGIRQKLGVAVIARYKLRWGNVSWQQEMTHPRGWVVDTRVRHFTRPRAVIERGVLVSPVLVLGFCSTADAARALRQHVCLSCNEDVLLPNSHVRPLSEADFDALPGFELQLAQPDDFGAFLVGHNRYAGNAPMYGTLSIVVPPPPLDELFSLD